MHSLLAINLHFLTGVFLHFIIGADILIQSGRDDLIPVLWEQIERFVAMQTNRWVQAWKSRRVEFEDLYQSGFLAVIQAVQTYDTEKKLSFSPGWATR